MMSARKPFMIARRNSRKAMMTSIIWRITVFNNIRPHSTITRKAKIPSRP
jgi:hypothetical protein